MGNFSSQEDENRLKAKTSAELVDYIASNYITSSSFKNLKRLNKKEYCDKMIVLTSDILNKYFDTVDISYIAERVKSGENTNIDKAYFIPTDDVSRLNQIEKKQEVCMGIAKFYITIAHVFAAIMTTMNPMVEYTDPNTGEIIQVSILEKEELPGNVAYEIIHKTSLCDRRIKSLQRGHGDVSADPTKEMINVHPRVCDINTKKNTHEVKSLDDEPGIPEFVQLYYDKYNPLTGEFDDYTNESKISYDTDLRIFYEVFTGKPAKDMPNHITKFSDIKLIDYNDRATCQGADPVLNRHVRGTVSQNLFKQYAENLTQMISNANKNQEALMEILPELFGYTSDDNGKKTVRVNSKLTEDEMEKIVIRCRKLIIKLTLQCEVDFTHGVQIYEAIIESKVFETVNNQIKNIDDEILNASADIPIPDLDELGDMEEPMEEEVAVPVPVQVPVPIPVPVEEAAVPVPISVPDEEVAVPVSVPEEEVAVPVPVPVPEEEVKMDVQGGKRNSSRRRNISRKIRR